MHLKRSYFSRKWPSSSLESDLLSFLSSGMYRCWSQACKGKHEKGKEFFFSFFFLFFFFRLALPFVKFSKLVKREEFPRDPFVT